MSLSDILNVQISRDTTVPSQVGFGTALFVSEHTDFDGRIKFYGDVDEVLEDFAENSSAAEAAAVYFSQEPKPAQIAIGRKTEQETWTEALSAIYEVNQDFYGVAIDSETEADILAVAGWTEARRLLFGARSLDEGIIDPNDDTDILSQLGALSYARTYLMYHSQADEVYPEMAWFGRMLPETPGSATWAFKTLAGIPNDELSTGAKNAVLNKNGNIYTRVAGVNITRNGTVSEPEFIDVIIGVDWLTARIQERIFGRLVNLNKIPFTDQGASIITSEIDDQLQIGIANDFLAADPAPTVNAPLVADVPLADKGNRRLPDVTFQATLAGAVHSAQINGTLVL